ncbi:MAG: XRE family transcriptional regulator [Rhodospirillaceae bacterium]|nr:XRE family transcriptional regulator [Rhodospirillaceae bacterium]
MIRYLRGSALVRSASSIKGAAAVIPKERLEKFITQMEDAADRASLEKKNAEYLPVALVERLIAGESAVRIFREWRGVSQDKLATTAGIGKSMLSQIESGKKEPSLVTARRLAAALDVTLEEIV